MRIARLLLLSLLFTGAVQARTPDLRGLTTLPLFDAPAPAMDKVLTPARKGEPLIIGRGVPLTLALDQGQWDELADGSWRWRARVHSAGAVALSFEFSEFQMPAGGELWIYDAQGRQMRGPYTSANQTPEGRLWTPRVPGDSAVIEAHVPADQRAALRLKLAQVNHGDRDILKATVPGSDTSGACNINVACSQGDAWDAEKRSAVLITASKSDSLISYEVLCSGVMVNDVPQDDQPYLLTANHCKIRSASTTGSSGNFAASSVTVYWLYQASSCAGTSGDDSLTNSAASFIANDATADFTLLKLNNAPAAGSNVHFAGWDVSGAGGSSGAGLHHPSGDIKKISLFSSTLTQQNISIGSGTTVDSWEVPHWDQGVTEEGSSGSGLWNQDHHLVGVLTAGSSACNSSGTGGNGDPDYYGRLTTAWSRSSALKAALDPANTGTTILCGRDSGGAACSAVVTPPVTTGGTGTTVSAPAKSGGGLPPLLLAGLLAGAALRRLRRAGA